MMKQYMYFSLVLLLPFLCACHGSERTESTDAARLDSLYDRVQDYMYEGNLADALSYVEAQNSSPDTYILRAYLQLYSMDSAQICMLLDSAWASSPRHGTEPELLYRRLVVSAEILTAESVGDFDRASSFAKRAVALREEHGSVGAVCEMSALLGMIHFHEGNIVESMKSYRQSLEHAVQVGDRSAEVQACLGLATLFHKWSRKKTELEYMQKAMSIVSGAHDVGIYQACIAARRAAMAFEASEETDSALFYYRQAYQVALTQGMTFYADMLNEDILRMLKAATQPEAHERPYTSGAEQNKALRALIAGQEREMVQLRENLDSSTRAQARSRTGLMLVCVLLAVAITLIAVYLSVSQRHSRRLQRDSESRIKEIEIALSKKEVDTSLAEHDAEKFLAQMRAKYPGFVPALMERESTMTRSDIILSCLIALGESTERIQELRHISKNSLWAARYRIRTKLHLGHDEVLTAFLYGMRG